MKRSRRKEDISIMIKVEEEERYLI